MDDYRSADVMKNGVLQTVQSLRDYVANFVIFLFSLENCSEVIKIVGKQILKTIID